MACRNQAQERNNQPCKRRDMVGGTFPLLQENNQKQRRHGEINSRGIQGKNISRQNTCQGANHPVALIEKSYKEKKIFPFNAFRRFCRTFQ